MRKWVIALISIALFCWSPISGAADDSKISVAVNHSGDDNIGQKLAFALREVIRASSGYQLVSGPSAIIRVSLVTLDPERSAQNMGMWTVASAVITMRNFNPFDDGEPQTWYPIYLTSSVVTSGTYKVEETAKSILASVDAAVEEYRSDARKK